MPAKLMFVSPLEPTNVERVFRAISFRYCTVGCAASDIARPVANLRSVRWQPHCRSLYQTPMAA